MCTDGHYFFINVQRAEQSRRDDLESLGYLLMYFLRGSLPWQGLRATTKTQKYERIRNKKMDTPVEVLCKGFPQEFMIYLNYTRSLRFEETPDYQYLKQLLRDLFIRERYTMDYMYDCTYRDFAIPDIYYDDGNINGTY